MCPLVNWCPSDTVPNRRKQPNSRFTTEDSEAHRGKHCQSQESEKNRYLGTSGNGRSFPAQFEDTTLEWSSPAPEHSSIWTLAPCWHWHTSW
jgi:hypothetical protein